MAMETQDCKGCGHKFNIEALTDGLCALCAGKSPQAKDVNKVRIVSSDTIREDDVVRIVKEIVPTREQIEVMIKLRVKEELAEMKKPPLMVISADGIQPVPSPEPISEPKTADSGRTIVFKTRNCIKCEQPFTPRSGNQKKCDNCRKETK